MSRVDGEDGCPVGSPVSRRQLLSSLGVAGAGPALGGEAAAAALDPLGPAPASAATDAGATAAIPSTDALRRGSSLRPRTDSPLPP